jgi:hypothetical protein
MRRGDFDAAWRVGDRILASRKPGEHCWDLPRHLQPVWDGRPIVGRRVLVRCYHGLGDTIQFARFLPTLDPLVRETIVWAQPTLIDLLETLPGARRILPLHDGDPGVDYDVDVEIMELAHVLRALATHVGGHVPYFHVRPAPRVSSELSVGVVAESGDWDRRRSIPVRLLVGALQVVPGVALYNLQLERPLPGMADLSTPSVLQLASRVRSLDLVITPDTMLAHLAGALGVPVWTLLPTDADWRWLGPDRDDSPWYPTMRLFRQAQHGDWRPVIDEVTGRLSALATPG